LMSEATDPMFLRAFAFPGMAATAAIMQNVLTRG
jgi:hypothetical protein